MIQKITHNSQLLALIVTHKYSEDGIHFFTDDDQYHQLAFMKHPAGKSIQPHVHNSVAREVHYTEEVLFIKKGKLRVDFYTEGQDYLESRVLEAGDVILLIQGGHGFEVLEEVVQRIAAGNPDMLDLLGEIQKKKRDKVIGRLSDTDAESIFNVIETDNPLSSE